MSTLPKYRIKVFSADEHIREFIDVQLTVGFNHAPSKQEWERAHAARAKEIMKDRDDDWVLEEAP